MKILVDADSCPVAVRDVICRAAKRTKIKAYFVANRNIPNLDPAYTVMELCPLGEGQADDRIVCIAEKNDIAITRDVPLAARLVENGIDVLDDRGRTFTKDNIRTLLSLRNFNVSLAENGTEIVRIANYSKKDLKDFADSFDKILTKNMRAA
ncbi:MAG: DUF188 domain-containing protein [Termitinemataceae bacterium]|nr:MAG: DUF188 domain-containing protein [Termitinemataceae bacterium]